MILEIQIQCRKILCEADFVGFIQASVFDGVHVQAGHYHVVSMAALLAMAGHEVVGLVAAYVGAQKAQALIPHIKSRPAQDSCCDVTGGN